MRLSRDTARVLIAVCGARFPGYVSDETPALRSLELRGLVTAHEVWGIGRCYRPTYEGRRALSPTITTEKVRSINGR